MFAPLALAACLHNATYDRCEAAVIAALTPPTQEQIEQCIGPWPDNARDQSIWLDQAAHLEEYCE